MDAREIKTKPNKQPQKCAETGTREKVVMRVVMRSLGIHKNCKESFTHSRAWNLWKAQSMALTSALISIALVIFYS